MKLVRRPYQREEDYWAIREFLRDVFLQNGRRQFSWPVARLDYWRWHVAANCNGTPIGEGTYLWETEDGKLVAVLNPEDPGPPTSRSTLVLEARWLHDSADGACGYPVAELGQLAGVPPG